MNLFTLTMGFFFTNEEMDSCTSSFHLLLFHQPEILSMFLLLKFLLKSNKSVLCHYFSLNAKDLSKCLILHTEIPQFHC